MQVLLARQSREYSWRTGGVLQIPYLNPSVFQCTNFSIFLSRSCLMLQLTSENGTRPRIMSPMARQVPYNGLQSINWYFSSQISVKISPSFRGCRRGSAREQSGAREGMRKWRSGYGTRFIVISLKSTLRTPSKRMEQVSPERTLAIMLFMRSQALFSFPVISDPLAASCCVPFPLFTISSTVLTMLLSAWLSMGSVQSAWLMISLKANKELYGDVTTSSFSLGKTEAVKRKISGNSSSSSPRMYVPSPDPVPPPREWRRKKLCRESHCSMARLILSTRWVRYLWPYTKNPCAQLLPAPETSLMNDFWSKISPISLLRSWLVTPSSMSTTTARAFSSRMGVPSAREAPRSVLRKKLLRASSQEPSGLYFACSSSSNYQKRDPIWLPHWPTWIVISSRGMWVQI